MIEAYLVITNIILIGVVLITFRGAKRLHDEAKHYRRCSCLALAYIEKTTEMTAKEITDGFNIFLDEMVEGD